ncbi:MAG: hypothetical protein Q9M92_17995 [Enterobacterales bacterium]|nr:hypothetical protein [Enterobacterales bacterium]
MSNTNLKVLLALAVGVIVGLLVQPKEERRYSDQEIDNINSTLSQRFNKPSQKSTAALPAGHPMNTAPQSSMTRKPPVSTSAGMAPMMQQMPGSKDPIVPGKLSIIGIIYKRDSSTWFFKAKDSIANIDRINTSFKKYFLDDLKFDGDKPNLSHIPETMQAPNTSSMRVATFMLDGVEISVSQLAGQQNVFSNVQRWMRQIGMTDNSAIQLDFKDNKKTIYVRLPRPKATK